MRFKAGRCYCLPVVQVPVDCGTTKSCGHAQVRSWWREWGQKAASAAAILPRDQVTDFFRLKPSPCPFATCKGQRGGGSGSTWRRRNTTVQLSQHLKRALSSLCRDKKVFSRKIGAFQLPGSAKLHLTIPHRQLSLQSSFLLIFQHCNKPQDTAAPHYGPLETGLLW